MNVKTLILSSLEPILQKSKFVTINHNKIKELAQKIKDYPIPPWDNSLQFFGNAEQTAQYYFFLDSINFCYWALKGQEKWSFQKDGEWLQGYYAYSYAIKKAFDQNSQFFDAKYLAEIPYEEFSKVFEGKNELLLLKERHQIINENFRILSEKFEGQAAKLVQSAAGDVNKLVNILIETFPTFRDSVKASHGEVYFLKRAQILVSDLYYAFAGEGLGEFSNMADLAVFSDYKLPQLLQAEGVMEYSAELLSKVQNEELIESGSEEEMEIRAYTIYACELLREELGRIGRELTSNKIDWMLWVQAKQNKFTLSHHKTITINY
jgi:hypothetical protein